eukprot:4808428-Amphidinium_carterae.6
MADIFHYTFRKELASKSPSSPTLDHWARADDGSAWIRVHYEPRDVHMDYSVNDDCTLPFDSRTVDYVTVERNHINGESTADIIPMNAVVNVPLGTMPWTGRTKYHLKQVATVAPLSTYTHYFHIGRISEG